MGIARPGRLAIGDKLTAEQETPRQLRPLRVLLAEDSLVNQKLAIGPCWKNTAIRWFIANDGKRSDLQPSIAQDFDLVLMDVQMPGMDGFEATEAIRAKEKQTGGHLPIVAMTAHALKGDRERCLKAGMDDYIAKPIRARQLLDIIGTAHAVGTVPDGADDPTSPGEEDLDWAGALKAMQEDRALLKEVVEAALEECPRLMTAIRQAVADDDATALCLAGHTLKGSVRYFGESPVFTHAYRLERMGRNGNLDEAKQALPALEDAVEQLMRVLQEHVRADEG